MDLTIAMAALKRKRKQKKRMMKLLRALREKAKECELLKRMRQIMLAKKAADRKLADVFMLFIEAIGRNDAENALKLAEKAMKGAILNMMNGGVVTSHDGHNGGFAADDR